MSRSKAQGVLLRDALQVTSGGFSNLEFRVGSHNMYLHNTAIHTGTQNVAMSSKSILNGALQFWQIAPACLSDTA